MDATEEKYRQWLRQMRGKYVLRPSDERASSAAKLKHEETGDIKIVYMRPNANHKIKRSSMPVKKYMLTMKNDLTDLEKLRSFVEEIREGLSFSKKCKLETNLALEEAFSNILSYGFDKHTDYFIKITITSAQGVLNIRVEDDGKAFNPLEAKKEPTLQYDIENCAPGGLGIHLIKHFMDEIRYKRYQNKNVLTMKKKGCFHERSNFRNPLSCA